MRLLPVVPAPTTVGDTFIVPLPSRVSWATVTPGEALLSAVKVPFGVPRSEVVKADAPALPGAVAPGPPLPRSP